MGFAKRPLISEPFVNQTETIDKALIEVQNHPSSYYGRRNRAVNASPGGNSPAPGAAAAKYGHGSSMSSEPSYNPNYYSSKYAYYPAGLDQYDQFRGTGARAPKKDSAGSLSGPGSGAGSLSGSVSGPGSGSVGPSAPAVGSVDMLGGLMAEPLAMPPNAAVGHIPQVFNDEKVFPVGSSPSFGEKKVDDLSTFDPFGSTSAFSQEPLFTSPLFSSGNMLGSKFTSTSSNIWGNNNKGMGDAAVWG